MKKLNLVWILLLLLKCSSVPPIPSNNDHVAIGITVVINIHTKLISWDDLKPEKIYFVKLNSINDNILKNEIIESNYTHESLWGSLKNDSIDNYILDLKPGIYAAVGAYGLSRNTNEPYFILFPEKAIKASVIDVKPNSFRYMGKYVFNTGEYFSNINKSDEVQKHYYNVFFPINTELKEKSNILVKYVLDSGKISGSVKEISNSNSDELNFLKNNEGVFKKTNFEKIMRNRIIELKSM